MSVLRPRLARLAFAAAFASAVAACDQSPTEPTSALSRVQPRSFSIDGDTLACRSGWTVQNGRYVCNEE